MDNLRQVIKTLFCEANAEDILQHNRSPEPKKSFASDVSEDWLIDVLDHNSKGYTRDEVRYLQHITNDHWLYAPRHGHEKNTPFLRKSVFYTLLHFTDKILLEEDDEPICEFKQLLRWRELSYLMGEDIFTLAHLAYHDIICRRKRNYFSWRPVINNNNKRLREVLSRGISELHFHLWGSAFVNEINWVSLMNDVTERSEQFAKLKSPKAPDTIYGFTGNAPLPLHERCLKAAAMRVYLFQETKGIYKDQNDSNNWLTELIYSKTRSEAAFYRMQLQSRINYLRYEFGYKCEEDILDYALPNNLTRRDEEKPHKANLILAGERKLIYDAFRKCYSDSDKTQKFTLDPDFETILYAYLIIKNDFRKELVQINDRIGFANFAEYQDRKEYFLKEDSIYDKIMGPTAILSTMHDQSVDYLEARIAPKKNVAEQIKAIKVCDSKIKSPLFRKDHLHKHCKICTESEKECKVKNQSPDPEFYYVLHFIKTAYAEDKIKDEIILNRKPRNWALRKNVKSQAFALNEIRKSHSDIKYRIAGIDAANSEIGYRPELFAQAFRYLREYSYRFPEEYVLESHYTQIGITYHAGEDYLDIVDGLRAIDETVIFLNYKSGDRIGHALALGIDPMEYYRLKNNTLIMPKHDYIDNLAWLLMKIRLFDIDCSSTLISRLKSEFKRVYYEIYQKDVPDLDNYYQAWLLRGDDPMNYYYYDKKYVSNVAFSFWEKCGTNQSLPEMQTARNNKEVRKIIHDYHFNVSGKLRGKKSEEFEVIDGYDRLVAAIQKEMRLELARKHIAIECNPTSNHVIGTYKRYANHPILAFNNHRLHHDPAKIQDNPQLSVSLNTDDQGVFSTNLENEYALMAIALEKEKDENGNPKYTSMFIYDYLDHIRRLGHEQRFVKKRSVNS